MSKKQRLTAKQKLFADEYIKSGNATQAAIKAGYSENYSKAQANKLLVNVGVKSYIDGKMAEIESHKIADGAEVMKFLTRVLRGEEKETVIVPTPTGTSKEQKEPDVKTRLQAGREILKRYPIKTDAEEYEAQKLLKSAQARKALAEAKQAEMQLKAMEDADSSSLNVTIVDRWDKEEKGGD